jgi:hypothetical protein
VAIARSVIPQLPIIASTSGLSEDRTSTLVLSEREDVLTWRLVRGSGLHADDPAAVIATARLTGPLTGSSPADLPANLKAVSQLAARLAVGGAEGVATLFANVGIGFVLVPPDNKALTAALDATEGLSRAAETDSGVCWRVGAATDAARPSWLRLLGSDGTAQALAATGASVGAGAAGRTLLLAETADAGWRATQNGVALEPVTVGWQQGFTVLPEAGLVEVEYRSDPWIPVQAVVLVLLTLTALPLRRRRSEESES